MLVVHAETRVVKHLSGPGAILQTLQCAGSTAMSQFVHQVSFHGNKQDGSTEKMLILQCIHVLFGTNIPY